MGDKTILWCDIRKKFQKISLYLFNKLSKRRMVSWLPLSNVGPVWDSYILLFSHSSEIRGYCLMKLSRKNASEFANIFEIRKPKLRKKICLRIPKIWQIWSISLDNFIKHKPLISKRWCYREQKTNSSLSIYIQLFFRSDFW